MGADRARLFLLPGRSSTRVLVTGGRDYSDRGYVHRVLSHLHAQSPFAVLIHGGATGADSLAGLWALYNRVPVDPYPVQDAEWAEVGVHAGSIRNARMLRLSRPTVGVAFPGGGGTADMVRRLLAAGFVERVRV